MHASSALFDAAVSSERPAREQLTPETQESKAASQWKSLFAGHHKRKGRLAPVAETPQPKTKPAEQLYLDFGQRSFGQRQECKTCGLLYTLGQPEDEEMHRRHHRRVVQGISMHPSAADRVVRQLPDGGRTLLILPSDPADRLRKLAEVTALMAAELGGEPSLPRDGRAFLLADSSARRYRLLGCAIAEPLQRAFRALPQDDASGSGVLRHGGIPQPALCGVSHIWVCAAHRRRGVARQLLDAIRSNMLSGFELPIDRLAFSQPTAQGRALAESYTGTVRFLVYAERPAHQQQDPPPPPLLQPPQQQHASSPALHRAPHSAPPPAPAAARTELEARPAWLPADYELCPRAA